MLTPQMPLRVAQLTDMHLYADASRLSKGIQTSKTFQAVLNALALISPKPDVVLLTGDLSNDETIGSYQNLYRSLAPFAIPTYWIAGNHDLPDVMEPILSQPPFSQEKAFQLGNWQFIMLNSRLAQHVEGELSEETLSWLDDQLVAHPLHPTLVALHHPPLLIGSTWMDEIGLQNRDRLFQVLDRHPQVRLVLFGHIHQAFDRWRNDVRYLGTPSTCVQFIPDCNEFAIDSTQQPGFRLLTLYPDGRFDTTVERINSCIAIPNGL